mgnify:CR=1 FL=1
MRSLIILITLFLFFWITSCEDIVNSDKNIRITEVEYKSIKEDQENNVIMPLKAGNIWYYDVTEYNDDEKISEYIDSVYIIKEVTLNGEIWYETYYPMLSEENIYLSNTNEGLWVKCENCENVSFLLARYPNFDDVFASGYPDIRNLHSDDESVFDILDDLLISKRTNRETISVPKGEYDCIKYTGKFESENQQIAEYPVLEEYYSENDGLVKMTEYELLSDKYYKTFELRDEPIVNDDCLVIIQKDIGDIQAGNPNNQQFSLVNNTTRKLSITDIEIQYTGLNDIARIDPDFESSLPVLLLKDQSVNMNVLITPQTTGRFNITIKVISDIGCFYEIVIEGRSV